MINKQIDTLFKFISSFLICLIIRLIPFKPPNVEPLLSVQMPYAKKSGPILGFLFGLLGIVFFDFLTKKAGLWTFITGLTYGIIGFWSYFYFKNRKNSSLNYLKFAFFATLFYDAITGLTIGPLMFKQSFMEALLGQIPFTLNHLSGNLLLAFILSPLIYKWVAAKPKDMFRSILDFRLKNKV